MTMEEIGRMSDVELSAAIAKALSPGRDGNFSTLMCALEMIGEEHTRTIRKLQDAVSAIYASI